MLSYLRHTDFALSELRIEVKTYYIALNERCKKYEGIKDQFRRYQHLAKAYERAA